MSERVQLADSKPKAETQTLHTRSELWIGHPLYLRYQGSTHGRIRPVSSRVPLGLRPNLDTNYLQTDVRDGEGKKHTVYVHRFILECFEGFCPVGCEARHLDGKRSNCSVWNLCWGTKSQNIADKIQHGTILAGTRHHWTSRLTEELVGVVRWFYFLGLSQAELCSGFDLSSGTVSRLVNRRIWKHD